MDSPLIHITADEINCLIYSYFKDSGFTHSAFTLRSEGALQKSPWYHKHIPRGELVDLLSKALLYIEVESHWHAKGMVTTCNNKFSLLEHHVCSTEPSSSASLKSPVPTSATSCLAPSLNVPIINESLSSDKDALTPQDARILPVSSETFNGNTVTNQAHSNLTPSDPPVKRKVSPIQIDGPAEKRAKHESDDMDVDVSVKTDVGSIHSTVTIQHPHVPVSPVAPESKIRQDSNTIKLARPRIHHLDSSADKPLDHKAIMMLSGHRTEVFVCSFNPQKHAQLATGSKDAVVNLWDIPEPPISKTESITWTGHPITIDNHNEGISGDTTSLNWNPEGTLLAVGSYDTVLRILTVEGVSYFTHHQHRGPIFSVRFSPNGNWLLSASLDETTCLYDVKERRLVRQYRCHQDCCLDTEWLDDTTFVTAGADGNIYIMKTDRLEPIKKINGHADEINQLKCNPSRTRLASCSDDSTARIWDVENIEPDSDESIPGLGPTNQTFVPAVVLTGHKHSVSMIGWMPGHRSGIGNEIVATSSFDCTVRIWDTVTGKCLKLLSDHQRPVYTLTFSPDGRWLASGSGDGWLHVYCVKTWEKRWSWYAGHIRPGVFEIAWQMVPGVSRLAVALENQKVAIIDASRIPALQDSELIENGIIHNAS